MTVDAGRAELAGRHASCANRVLAVACVVFELMSGNQGLCGNQEDCQNQVECRFVAGPGHWLTLAARSALVKRITLSKHKLLIILSFNRKSGPGKQVCMVAELCFICIDHHDGKAANPFSEPVELHIGGLRLQSFHKCLGAIGLGKFNQC